MVRGTVDGSHCAPMLMCELQVEREPEPGKCACRHRQEFSGDAWVCCYRGTEEVRLL